MTEKEMLELILEATMSGDPLKTQVVLKTIKDEHAKVIAKNTELTQQIATLSDQITQATQERDQFKNEKETIAKMYHDKWQASPVDDKVKDEPEIVDPESVVNELFSK